MPVKGKPITIPAIELNEFWVSSFQSLSASVGGRVYLTSQLIPYNASSNKTGEPINLDPVDIFAEIETNPLAALVYFLTLPFLQRKAVEQGKLEVDENSTEDPLVAQLVEAFVAAKLSVPG